MNETAQTATRPCNTYGNGQPYRPARGRYAPRQSVDDYYRSFGHAVVDLDCERPTRDEFLHKIDREWKIRFYSSSSKRNYSRELRIFVDWFGSPPHLATREDVRDFLEFLADSGRSSSTVSNYLAAIRNAFDKMCLRDITLGLQTPRKPRRIPVTLNTKEIELLLAAAICLRDKLLLGMLYATGARNKEICRLKWTDLDFERRIVTIWQGKGRTDRQVMLPATYLPLLRELAREASPDGYVFPGERPGRHISPRTVQRIMKRTLRLAGIHKPATPHSLRHSFASHLFEDGVDLRYIQKLLGHVKLETTTIYTKVARSRPTQLASPLDRLAARQSGSSAPPPAPSTDRPPVGKLKIHMRAAPDCKPDERRAQVTLDIQHPRGGPIYLTGIVVREMRPGWLNIEVPPLESWSDPLRGLTAAQRERLEAPEFYEMLQREISRRFSSQFRQHE
jgi:site-specific recombinase XerD